MVYCRPEKKASEKLRRRASRHLKKRRLYLFHLKKKDRTSDNYMKWKWCNISVETIEIPSMSSAFLDRPSPFEIFLTRVRENFLGWLGRRREGGSRRLSEPKTGSRLSSVHVIFTLLSWSRGFPLKFPSSGGSSGPFFFFSFPRDSFLLFTVQQSKFSRLLSFLFLFKYQGLKKVTNRKKFYYSGQIWLQIRQCYCEKNPDFFFLFSSTIPSFI